MGQGFDANPVMWRVLAERGVVVRGPAPESLGLDAAPELLRAWNLANLHEYWEPRARRTLEGRDRLGWRIRPRYWTEWPPTP